MTQSTFVNKQLFYDSSEFTVADAVTDQDVKATESDAFDRVTVSGVTHIITDQTISIRLNDVTSSVMTVTSSESPLILDAVKVNNLFISNSSGAGANIKVKLFQN